MSGPAAGSKAAEASPGVLLAYVTVPDAAGDGADALRLARSLVERGLAAGVNIVPGVASVYRWRGEVREARERVLLAQVTARAFAAFCEAVSAAHPHVVPCVLGLSVAAGHGPFVRWICENSAPPA
ncbi:divalent-cation tolerance protein CutA [Desulfovibrio sp.]|uniref:divalent-cation tolerance protein CutA n=1 Tax=Desulfovibrio sp. TaxID=885 RepID=UPI002627ADA9|nr:divalent-cation tolerance protein CutA [Desulfovibrio sp.]